VLLSPSQLTSHARMTRSCPLAFARSHLLLRLDLIAGGPGTAHVDAPSASCCLSQSILKSKSQSSKYCTRSKMKAKTKKPIVKRSVVVAGHKTSVPDVAEQGDELPTAHVGHEPPSQVTSIRTLSLPQRGRGRSEKARS